MTFPLGLGVILWMMKFERKIVQNHRLQNLFQATYKPQMYGVILIFDGLQLWRPGADPYGLNYQPILSYLPPRFACHGLCASSSLEKH